MPKFAVILPAAGASSRFHNKSYKKPFAPLAGRAVWLHAAEKFLHRSDVAQTMVVVAPEDREDFDFKFSSNVAILGLQVVAGGADRASSVMNALARVKAECDFVCVHDAVRPCVADEWITQVFEVAARTGAAMLARPLFGTIKRVKKDHTIETTVDREGLWEAQTPQVFRKQMLLDAYAQRGDFQATDDAQLVERLGEPVTVVQGSYLNIKITTQDDLKTAEWLLKAMPKPKNLGLGNPFAADDMWR